MASPLATIGDPVEQPCQAGASNYWRIYSETINKQVYQEVSSYQPRDLLRDRALELKIHILDPFLSLLLL
jgi:hypothetical protein